RSFAVPRRRRRQAPLSAGTPAANAAGAIDASTAQDGGLPAAARGGAAAPRSPRPRLRRRRRAGLPGAAPAEDGATAPQARSPRPRRGPSGERRDDREGGSTERRGARPHGDGSARREGRRDGPPGRGRRDGREAPRRVERKLLYTTDTVVDRGFDDVEEEAGARRVHWTIVKRTTADQVSRKAVSAVYVLQRDGADSEFPSLGAARDAVNKKIVHPEKLTRSKAEYAAEKSGKK
ncbi:MAG TPA: hypothetical protein VME41_08565, partial [Stellaceae bacterium]|nr:hypothetical protein [Stellaceae bacterium]